MSPRVHLASSSPQRYRLLKAIGIECTVIRPNIDETPLTSETPGDYVIRLAVQKSNKAAQLLIDEVSNDVIVAADTCVAIDQQKLGKPTSGANASDMLKLLSGQVHQVYSAVAVLCNRITRCVATVTDVEFRSLSERDIEAYLASGESNNRAGAYAIQGNAGAFVKRLTGSVSGVIGMPVKETAELLSLAGVAVPSYATLAERVRTEFTLIHNWPGQVYI